MLVVPPTSLPDFRPLILKIDTLCQSVSLIFYFVLTSDGMITTFDAVREPSLFNLPCASMASPTASVNHGMMIAESVSLRGFADSRHEAAYEADLDDRERKDTHLPFYVACYATSIMIQIPPSSSRDLHLGAVCQLQFGEHITGIPAHCFLAHCWELQTIPLPR